MTKIPLSEEAGILGSSAQNLKNDLHTADRYR